MPVLPSNATEDYPDCMDMSDSPDIIERLLDPERRSILAGNEILMGRHFKEHSPVTSIGAGLQS